MILLESSAAYNLTHLAPGLRPSANTPPYILEPRWFEHRYRFVLRGRVQKALTVIGHFSIGDERWSISIIEISNNHQGTLFMGSMEKREGEDASRITTTHCIILVLLPFLAAFFLPRMILSIRDMISHSPIFGGEPRYNPRYTSSEPERVLEFDILDIYPTTNVSINNFSSTESPRLVIVARNYGDKSVRPLLVFDMRIYVNNILLMNKKEWDIHHDFNSVWSRSKHVNYETSSNKTFAVNYSCGDIVNMPFQIMKIRIISPTGTSAESEITCLECCSRSPVTYDDCRKFCIQDNDTTMT